MRMILAWINALYSGTPPPLCRSTALTLAWLTNRHKRALYEALEKVKAELMILGFISLTLVFSQYYIAEICIPPSVADTILPCSNKEYDKDEKKNCRRHLSYECRVLASKASSCTAKGRVLLITVDGLHQIHILTFFLAVLHVLYSAITMALGRLKAVGIFSSLAISSVHPWQFGKLQFRSSSAGAGTSLDWSSVLLLALLQLDFRTDASSAGILRTARTDVIFSCYCVELACPDAQTDVVFSRYFSSASVVLSSAGLLQLLEMGTSELVPSSVHDCRLMAFGTPHDGHIINLVH
ncbi:hypothetical protein C2S51_032797 [Perilla frutescens var. frutescens]|nr:hypothetical protein C2S51_032797 [Perilla frutescens var. frutescens]